MGDADNADPKDGTQPDNAGQDGGDAGDDTQNSEGKTTDGGGDSGSDGGDDEGEGGSDADKGKPSPKDGDAGDGNDDPPVRKTVRKSPKDYIIDRKNRQLERARQGKPKGNAGDGGDDGGNGDGGNDDDIDSKVESIIDKKLEPHFEEQQALRDRSEVDAYLERHPAFKPFRDKALKLMKHPSRQHLPVDTVMAEAAGGTSAVMKLGARANQDADEEADREGGGSGHAPAEGQPSGNVWGKSKGDFKKQQEEVRRKAG